MTGFNAESYASSWRSRNKKEQKRIEQLAGEALQEANRLAGISAEKAGIGEVILFGSLAEGTVKRDRFDIDLAIRGGDWFRACEVAERSRFAVDVVEYGNLPKHLQRRIDEKGKVLVKKRCKIDSHTVYSMHGDSGQ